MPPMKIRREKVESGPKECLVCYSDLSPESVIFLPCRCKACTPCLVQWIIAKLEGSHGNNHYPIPCLNLSCKKTFKVQDVFFRLSPEDQNKINELLFKGYLSEEKDISKCPNPKCQYAGVIDLKYCKGNLNCNACGATWRDPQQSSKTEILRKHLEKFGTHKNEVFSQVRKFFLTKECPQCHVSIQKNQGCNHMTCSRCTHQFCWICKNNHPSHNRGVHTFHAAKMFLLALIAFIFVIFALYKLYCFPPINFILSWTLVPVLGFIFSPVFWVFSMLVWILKGIFGVVGWIFLAVFKFVLLGIMFLCIQKIREGRLRYAKLIFTKVVLLTGVMLTLHFETLGMIWSLLKISFLGVAILFIFGAGYYLHCILRRKSHPINPHSRKIRIF